MANSRLRTSLSFKTALSICVIVLLVYLIGKYYLHQSRSITTHTHSDELSFFPHNGKNSIGGDLIYAGGELSIDQLKVLCHQTIECVGFTTDGYLKHTIQPYNEWTNMKDKRQGLYTLDIKYCDQKKAHSCSVVGSTCLDAAYGTYYCDSLSTVHIGVSVDIMVIEGLVATIQSIIKHQHSRKYTIVIHILVKTADEKRVQRRVECSIVLPSSVLIEYTAFDLPNSTKDMIRVHKQHENHLTSSTNFARFYLAQIYSSLSYLIYLDVDIIVQHDIGDLWEQVINTDKLLMVVNRPFDEYCHLKYNEVSRLYYERYNVKFEKDKCPCNNGGVFGINLKKWRDGNMLEEAEYWMKKNMEYDLWSLGTQPILYILSYDDWKGISQRWNVRYNHLKSLKSAYIIHWCGSDKPWQENLRGTEANKIWEEYNIKENNCREEDNELNIH